MNIPYPPDFIFKYRKERINPAENVIQNREFALFLYDRMEFPASGGLNVYYKDVPFPRKGLPFPEAVYAANQAKSITMTALRLLTKWPRKENFIDAYITICDRSLKPYVLEDQYYIPFVREILHIVKNFLMEIGVDEERSQLVAEDLATQIEYDDAYRLPLQDALNHSLKDRMLEDPRKEIKYLIDLINYRDKGLMVANKFTMAGKILRMLLLVPSYKKAFKIAIGKANYTKIQFDKADDYNVLLWNNYNFLGLSTETRSMLYDDVHKDGYPPHMIYKQESK